MDEDLKRKFDCFCADAGLNASVAVNMFVRAVVREKKIPFIVEGSVDPFFSEKNMSELRRRIADIEDGINVSYHELIEVPDDE